MNTITFHAVVSNEQVIRPPVDVHLPQGEVEVTIKPAASEVALVSVKSANESLRLCRVSLGRVTGIENEGIDADLARIYGEPND